MSRTIHPQAVPGEPNAVRWVSDTGQIPVGEVLRAPGTLGPLLEYGVITRMAVERGGVWSWLAPELSWAEHGPRIRDAIVAALALEGWEIRDDADGLLALVAQDLLAGELKSYIASHGGVITVEGVSDGVVTVDFGGACEDCPAAGSTLHDRIEASLRDRVPSLKSVQRAQPTRHSKAWLGIPLRSSRSADRG